MSESALCKLKKMGQSVWLDFISRDLIQSGQLKELVKNDCVCGVTVNPTIFEQAMVGSDLYNEDISNMLSKGFEIADIYHKLMVADVVEASKILWPLYEKSNGLDGYVSIEVAPKYAHDAKNTIKEAHELWSQANHLQNIMIKVPGTEEGQKAIRHLTAEGFNINVTLLFSPGQYKKSADAYLAGIKQRADANSAIDKINSVASVFISRIDTLVDKKLDDLISRKAEDKKALENLKGKIGVAIVKQTYREYKELLKSKRWKDLAACNANPQRVLWASTSTKNPAYSEVKYVEELMASMSINTMPLKTLSAFRDYENVRETIEDNYDEAKEDLALVEKAGLNLNEVFSTLEEEGIQKFEDSYKHLFSMLEEKCENMRAA